MDKNELLEGAFIAWRLAIEGKINGIVNHGQQYPNTTSIQDLASQYGARITNRECLDEVSEWFNWDVITEYLTKVSKESQNARISTK